jgi:hypothetical protein
MEQAVNTVCKTLGVNVEDVYTSKRERHIVDARRISMNILIREEKISISAVARFLKKNHATGIHHKKSHEVLYESEKAYRSAYDLCILNYKDDDKSTFSDVLALSDKYKDLTIELEKKDEEISTLKYDILKLENKLRANNFTNAY